MPKEHEKKYNILQKFYLVWKLLYYNPIIEHCQYCGSLMIGKADSAQDGDIYKGVYWCKKCGATMVLVEKWKRKEVS